MKYLMTLFLLNCASPNIADTEPKCPTPIYIDWDGPITKREVADVRRARFTCGFRYSGCLLSVQKKPGLNNYHAICSSN